MRLIVNGRFLGRPSTGVDRTALELTTALADLQQLNDFELLVAVPPGVRDAAVERLGDRTEIVSVGRPSLGGHLWEQIALARFEPSAWLLSLGNTGPILRKRQLALVHDAQFRTQPESYSWPFRAAYSVLIPALLRRASRAATVSQHSRNELEQCRLAPPGKLRLLPNGANHLDRVVADVGALERYDLQPEQYFLAVGSLAPHKNLQLLYDAVLLTPSLRSPLVVVGSVDERVLRGQQATDSPRIRAIGRVSDEELKSLYANALALCIPSLTEGFGLAAIEAMHCGTPVLAADAGALPDTCGSAALLLPPTDRDAWARAMAEVEEDLTLRKQLSDEGLRHSKKYQWTTIAKQIIEDIRSPVERRGWFRAGTANTEPVTPTATVGESSDLSADLRTTKPTRPLDIDI